jgi:hypothetical protein
MRKDTSYIHLDPQDILREGDEFWLATNRWHKVIAGCGLGETVAEAGVICRRPADITGPTPENHNA